MAVVGGQFLLTHVRLLLYFKSCRSLIKVHSPALCPVVQENLFLQPPAKPYGLAFDYDFVQLVIGVDQGGKGGVLGLQ